MEEKEKKTVENPVLEGSKGANKQKLKYILSTCYAIEIKEKICTF